MSSLKIHIRFIAEEKSGVEKSEYWKWCEVQLHAGEVSAQRGKDLKGYWERKWQGGWESNGGTERM